MASYFMMSISDNLIKLSLNIDMGYRSNIVLYSNVSLVSPSSQSPINDIFSSGNTFWAYYSFTLIHLKMSQICQNNCQLSQNNCQNSHKRQILLYRISLDIKLMMKTKFRIILITKYRNQLLFIQI